MSPRRFLSIAAPVFAFALFSLALTWPLVMNITTRLPLGSERSPTVPFLNLWTIGWNGQSLREGYGHYWDAPIFHPARGAFAFSDPQPISAIVGALSWQQSPALAYNLTLVGYMTLNGLAGFTLLRTAKKPVPVALLGALLIQALPFLTHERGVIQMQPIFGPIWAIQSGWQLFRHGKWLFAAKLSLSFILTFYSSEYFALALIPLLGLVFLIWLPRAGSRRTMLKLVIAVMLIALFVLPSALPQAKLLANQGFERTRTSITRFSAAASDYLRPSWRLRFADVYPQWATGPGSSLFPGISLSILAASGLVTGIRRNRKWTGLLITMAILAFVLSLGVNFRIIGSSPYLFAFENLAGIGWIRSPFRAAAFVHLAIALLASNTLEWMHRRRVWLFGAATLITLLELVPSSERLAAVPSLSPSWSAPVAIAEPRALVHLPWPQERATSNFEQTTTWMNQSLALNIPIANGYSGFFPAINQQLRDLLENFPSDQGVRALQALGVDHALIHNPSPEMTEERLEPLLASGLISVAERTSDWVLLVVHDSQVRLNKVVLDWRLRVRQHRGSIDIDLLPEVSDEDFYVYTPELGPLIFLLRIEGQSSQRSIAAQAKGLALIFHGSGSYLDLIDIRDLEPGQYQLTLFDETGSTRLSNATMSISE